MAVGNNHYRFVPTLVFAQALDFADQSSITDIWNIQKDISFSGLQSQY